jgi:hypothetical protein
LNTQANQWDTGWSSWTLDFSCSAETKNLFMSWPIYLYWCRLDKITIDTGAHNEITLCVLGKVWTRNPMQGNFHQAASVSFRPPVFHVLSATCLWDVVILFKVRRIQNRSSRQKVRSYEMYVIVYGYQDHIVEVAILTIQYLFVIIIIIVINNVLFWPSNIFLYVHLKSPFPIYKIMPPT